MKRLLYSVVLLVLALCPGTATHADVFQDAAKGNVAAVRAALEKDHTLLRTTDAQHGATLLHWGVSGRNLAMVKFLLTQGVRVNARDNGGMTPLYNAAYFGAAEIAQLLLAAGADPRLRDTAGNTALHAAAVQGKAEVIYTLVLGGADPTVRNRQGLTPHEVAFQAGQPAVVATLADAEVGAAGQPIAVRAVPSITLPDLDGKPVDIAGFKGKVVVLCPWFISGTATHYQHLVAAQKLSSWPQAKTGDLVVLSLTPHEPDAVRAFLREKALQARVLIDRQAAVKRALQLVDRPAVVIGRDGSIFWRRRCASLGALALAVRRALAQNAMPPTIEAQVIRPSEQAVDVIESFENGYAGWQFRGDCWRREPSTESIFPGLVKGYLGKRFVNTSTTGWETTGIARSREFTLARPYAHLLVGGNDLPERGCVCLVVRGVAVRVATGNFSAELLPVTWDTRAWTGQQAHLEIIDAGKDDYRDFLLVDQFVQSGSATPPAELLHGFDPDDPAQLAASDAEIGPFWRDLRAGRAHMEWTPGKRYHIEYTWEIAWPTAAKGVLTWAWPPPPTSAAQTVHSAEFTLHAGDREYRSQQVPTCCPVMPTFLECHLAPEAVPDRRATGTATVELTTNRGRWVRGIPATPVPDLPPDLRARLTTANDLYPYEHPLYREFLDRYKLRIRPGETESAFMLRVDRFMSRHAFGWGLPWGGYPVPVDTPPLVSRLVSLSADCGMATAVAGVLRANGIPACGCQGGWTPENGEPLGAHVRLLAFLRGLGWVISETNVWMRPDTGPISPTADFGDNLMLGNFDDGYNEGIKPATDILNGQQGVPGWLTLEHTSCRVVAK